MGSGIFLRHFGSASGHRSHPSHHLIHSSWFTQSSCGLPAAFTVGQQRQVHDAGLRPLTIFLSPLVHLGATLICRHCVKGTQTCMHHIRALILTFVRTALDEPSLKRYTARNLVLGLSASGDSFPGVSICVLLARSIDITGGHEMGIGNGRVGGKGPEERSQAVEGAEDNASRRTLLAFG
jgi:hypothetical protein